MKKLRIFAPALFLVFAVFPSVVLATNRLKARLSAAIDPQTKETVVAVYTNARHYFLETHPQALWAYEDIGGKDFGEDDKVTYFGFGQAKKRGKIHLLDVTGSDYVKTLKWWQREASQKQPARFKVVTKKQEIIIRISGAWNLSIRANPKWNRMTFNEEKRLIFLHYPLSIPSSGKVFVHKKKFPGSPLIQTFSWQQGW